MVAGTRLRTRRFDASIDDVAALRSKVAGTFGGRRKLRADANLRSYRVPIRERSTIAVVPVPDGKVPKA